MRIHNEAQPADGGAALHVSSATLTRVVGWHCKLFEDYRAACHQKVLGCLPADPHAKAQILTRE